MSFTGFWVGVVETGKVRMPFRSSLDKNKGNNISRFKKNSASQILRLDENTEQQRPHGKTSLKYCHTQTWQQQPATTKS